MPRERASKQPDGRAAARSCTLVSGPSATRAGSYLLTLGLEGQIAEVPYVCLPQRTTTCSSCLPSWQARPGSAHAHPVLCRRLTEPSPWKADRTPLTPPPPSGLPELGEEAGPIGSGVPQERMASGSLTARVLHLGTPTGGLWASTLVTQVSQVCRLGGQGPGGQSRSQTTRAAPST